MSINSHFLHILDEVVFNKTKHDIVLLDSVQFSCSDVSDSATPWTAARQASLSITISLLKLTSIELVTPSNHLVLCHALLLLPSVYRFKCS